MLTPSHLIITLNSMTLITLITLTALTGCEAEVTNREVYVSHPLDELPVGCEATRLSDGRWATRCDQGVELEPEVEPDLGEVEPDLGEVEPDLGELEPDLGELEPDLGELEPDLGELEPDLGELEPACDPPLSLSAPHRSTLPFSLVGLQASGGSGAWRFELVEGRSGALLNEQTGSYLAGSRAGETDVIKLTDERCEGEANFTMSVVHPLNVTPLSLQVEPQAVFTLEALEGSGDVALSVTLSESGGVTLGGLTYQAGPQLGRDLLEVRDLQTGERVQVTVSVVEEAPIQADLRLLALPVGAVAEVSATGGSGRYNLRLSPPLEAREELGVMVVSASAPTTQRVTLTDRFTGKTTQLQVQARASLSAEVPPQNDHFVFTRLRADHDLDGDGRRDLIMGKAQADVSALNGGAVMVFLSGDAPEGQAYPTTPSQVFAGQTRREEMGRDFELADLNGDGHLDLVYGSKGADVGFVDSGAIYVHYGSATGRFEEHPNLTFRAAQNDDALGSSVAVCDFNGDGLLDIAGGAMLYEDRRDSPISWNEGGVFIYLGAQEIGGREGALTFSPSPDQVVVAKRPENGGWTGLINHQAGHQVVAGDFNGDGLCDLAYSSVSWVLGARGVVYVHEGRTPDAWGVGGVSARPVVVIESDRAEDVSGQLGRRLAVGDLDGDGAPELVIGHHTADASSTNAGAVHVFKSGGASRGAVLQWGETAWEEIEWGEEERATPRTLSPYQAEWTYEGSQWDQLGVDVAVIDYDDTPPLDLMVTSLYGDGENGWDVGELRVFTGSEEGSEGLLSDTPALTLEGPTSATQMFESAACLGDLTGEGAVTWAIQSNRLGSEHFHVGALFLSSTEAVEAPMSSLEEGFTISEHTVSLEPSEADPSVLVEVTRTEHHPLTPLTPPLNPSGAQFGYDVAWVGDFDADGYEDAVVTASHASDPAGEINVGGIWLYRGGEGGELSEGERAARFPGLSSWDHTRGVSGVGDFNGDGYDDFAVAIGNDERPRAWTDDFWLPDDLSGELEASCAPYFNDQGGVYVFFGGPSADLRPDMVLFGGAEGLIPERITGGVDLNGDGLGDLAVGMIRADRPWGRDVGEVSVLYGRALHPTLSAWQGPLARPIEVICRADQSYTGERADDHFGYSLAGVRDLNEDGCDELAVGARLHEQEASPNQGGVFLIFGSGAPSCPTTSEALLIQGSTSYDQLGGGVAAGDVDGDGLDDLVMGAPYALDQGARYGGAWVMSGARLASAPRAPFEALFGREGYSNQQGAVRLWYEQGEAARWFVRGSADGSEAGWGVAVVEHPEHARGLIALGELKGAHLGAVGVGSVRLFEALNPAEGGGGAQGVRPTPVAVMYGETPRAGSRLGEALSASRVSPRLLIGAREGGGVGLDHGSAYTLNLSALWE